MHRRQHGFRAQFQRTHRCLALSDLAPNYLRASSEIADIGQLRVELHRRAQVQAAGEHLAAARQDDGATIGVDAQLLEALSDVRPHAHVQRVHFVGTIQLDVEHKGTRPLDEQRLVAVAIVAGWGGGGGAA